MAFDPDDVREIFARLGELESIERNPPRDFVYTVELDSGERVSGRVVDRTELGVILGGGGPNDGVPWDKVSSIAVTVE